MRDFGVGKSSVEEKCAEEIDVLTDEFTKHGNKPFNCMTLMPNAISNIICQVIFNKRCVKWNIGFGILYTMFC